MESPPLNHKFEERITIEGMKLLLSFALLGTLATPALACLDLDLRILRYNPVHPRSQAYRKALKEAKPHRVSLFPGKDRKLLRAYWEADAPYWSVSDAHRYRDVLVGGESPSAAKADGIHISFSYSSGARVVYNTFRGRVVSIMALSSQYVDTIKEYSVPDPQQIMKTPAPPQPMATPSPRPLVAPPPAPTPP